MALEKSADSIVVRSESVIYLERPNEGMNSMLNPHYIVGFVDGEGCFSISVNKNSGRFEEVRLKFEIELREDDLEILEKIQGALGCGQIYHLQYERYEKWAPHVKFAVGNFTDIYTKVIPFFKKYPLQAKKKNSFEAFCKVAEIIKSKEHLSHEGVARVRAIRKSYNNKKRYHSPTRNEVTRETPEKQRKERKA